jgi:uncharacterized membrane-anchored protein
VLRSRSDRVSPLEPLSAKVPEITAVFWIIKVLTTGVGEAASDFLGNTSVVLAGIVAVPGLWLVMRSQLRARTYEPVRYWSAVLMIAVFGTMAADGVHIASGLSYAVTTPICAIAVAVLFLLWHRSEGTLSIHSITTRRRETFYWLTVLATFALGTAAGDLTAITLHLGFYSSGLLFAGVIAVPALLWWRGALNPIAAFWASYVVTRPLGASFADWFGKEPARTGLGLGDGVVTAIGLLAILGLVAYVARTRHGVQEPRRAHAGRAATPAMAEA